MTRKLVSSVLEEDFLKAFRAFGLSTLLATLTLLISVSCNTVSCVVAFFTKGLSAFSTKKSIFTRTVNVCPAQRRLGHESHEKESDQVIHTLLDVMYARGALRRHSAAMHIHPTVAELVHRPGRRGAAEPLRQDEECSCYWVRHA